MAHTCHAIGCAVRVRPELLMCGRHWWMVSRPTQLAVWAAYRPGQCDDKNPSRAWLDAADAAIGEVAERTGHGDEFRRQQHSTAALKAALARALAKGDHL
jgi:hypothetical protein